MISQTIKSKRFLPKKFLKLPFEKIKKDILGQDYSLSIVLVGQELSKSLNFKYRKIKEAADVLSFALSPIEGEIFICPERARVKAREFFDPVLLKKLAKKISYENYLVFLVIHAMLHLKGLNHGAKMTSYEFAHYSRYRYRDI